YRTAVVGHSALEIGRQLKDINLDEPAAAQTRSGVVFVFGGQGEQWPGMGGELLAQEPVFRRTVEECDALLRHYVRWSLIEEMLADESRSRLKHTEFAQPVLLGLQLGLAALWRSWGLEPSAVVGHSVGEVAAACVAGALSVADAMRIAAHRGILMQRMHGQGAMLAVALPAKDAARVIEAFAASVGIAAVNSPAATVLSGEPKAVQI